MCSQPLGKKKYERTCAAVKCACSDQRRLTYSLRLYIQKICLNGHCTAVPTILSHIYLKLKHYSVAHGLHGRVVKGVGHLGHDEVMEAGGREFDPRPGHYSRMSF